MKKKETRYMSSMGLAFAEQREMRKLSRLAAQGWLLESFAFAGYALRRGQPQNLIYSLDMQAVGKEELEEYRETFRAGGWRPVCSAGEMHIFAAAPGTRPIHSDPGTHLEKYRRMSRITLLLTLVFLAITFAGIAVLATGLSEEVRILTQAVWLLLSLSAAVGIPSLMMHIAYRIRSRSLRIR